MAFIGMAMYANDTGYEPKDESKALCVSVSDISITAATPSLEYVIVTSVVSDNWMIGNIPAAYEVRPSIGVPVPKLQPVSFMNANVYDYRCRLCAPPNANKQLRSIGNKFKRHYKLNRHDITG